MKKRVIFYIIVMIFIIMFGICISKELMNNNKIEQEFLLDGSNKYRIGTNMKYLTMQNDGGSYNDLYYEVDLKNNIINVVTMEYHANLGGKSSTKKKVDTKIINEDLALEFKDLLDRFLLGEEEKYNDNNFFTISNLNTIKYIYNEESIKDLNELIDKIN